jgi:hypothetical protein
MTQLHYRPAPDPTETPIEDRLVFPRHSRPVRLRLCDTPPGANSSAGQQPNSMQDTGMWMDACLDQVQDRLDAVRGLLDAFDDDDGPWAA